MKKYLPTFAAGMLTMALVGSLSVGALAATGQLTITVDPINIQVNGQTFQPKDAQGNDVPVFSYNGTTYAPLRALAEAFGLEVGYDAGANMATVGEKGSGAQDPVTTPTPDTTASAADYSSWSVEEEAAYQEFKGMWEIETDDYDSIYIYITYKGSDIKPLISFLNANTEVQIKAFCRRLDAEAYKLNPGGIAQEYLFGTTELWVDMYTPAAGVFGYSKEYIDSLDF